MKVYVVNAFYDYEGEETLGVFDTKEKALDFIKKGLRSQMYMYQTDMNSAVLKPFVTVYTEWDNKANKVKDQNYIWE